VKLAVPVVGGVVDGFSVGETLPLEMHSNALTNCTGAALVIGTHDMESLRRS